MLPNMMLELEQKLDEQYLVKINRLRDIALAVNRTVEVVGTEMPDVQKQFIVWSLLENGDANA